MVWQPGQSGNPGGRNRDKPFRDALKRELDAAGEDQKSLRLVAQALIIRATAGEVAAIKEIADRLDGKPVQQIDGPGPEGEHVVRWLRDDEPDPV